jgi:hypothetical protein
MDVNGFPAGLPDAGISAFPQGDKGSPMRDYRWRQAQPSNQAAVSI